ncbi:hypothetical protein HpBGD43_11870 [Helicobacter pylori]
MNIASDSSVNTTNAVISVKITPNLIAIYYSLKSILVMKTALFKLLSQAIIPRYATNTISNSKQD